MLVSLSRVTREGARAVQARATDRVTRSPYSLTSPRSSLTRALAPIRGARARSDLVGEVRFSFSKAVEPSASLAVASAPCEHWPAAKSWLRSLPPPLLTQGWLHPQPPSHPTLSPKVF